MKYNIFYIISLLFLLFQGCEVENEKVSTILISENYFNEFKITESLNNKENIELYPTISYDFFEKELFVNLQLYIDTLNNLYNYYRGYYGSSLSLGPLIQNRTYYYTVDLELYYCTKCKSDLEAEVPEIILKKKLPEIYTFKTKAIEEIDTVTDIDGNIYETLRIGNQVWFAQNLRTSKYSNGEDAEFMNSTYNYSYLEYKPVNYPTLVYSHYYPFYVAKSNKNICPNGWHVPTVSDFDTLTKNLIEIYGDNYIYEIAAKFSNKSYLSVSYNLWTTDEKDEAYAYGISYDEPQLHMDIEQFLKTPYEKTQRNCIRCLKDN